MPTGILMRNLPDLKAMTDLPKGLRDRPYESALITHLEITGARRSGDGTHKYLFRLPTGNMIESAFSPDVLPCHMNSIPFNAVPEAPFERPTPERFASFRSAVVAGGVEATVRTECGADIEAAGGQLRRQYERGVRPQAGRNEVPKAL